MSVHVSEGSSFSSLGQDDGSRSSMPLYIKSGHKRCNTCKEVGHMTKYYLDMCLVLSSKVLSFSFSLLLYLQLEVVCRATDDTRLAREL